LQFALKVIQKGEPWRPHNSLNLGDNLGGQDLNWLTLQYKSQ